MLSLTMMLALFSLAGIPPVAGFFGKFFLFTAAAKQGMYILVFISVLKIYVDGKLMGSGQLEIMIPPYACVAVKIEKVGYLDGLIEFCNKPNYSPPPKTYFYQMEKDDAYDASVSTDVANVDIEIKTTKKEPRYRGSFFVNNNLRNAL